MKVEWLSQTVAAVRQMLVGDIAHSEFVALFFQIPILSGLISDLLPGLDIFQSFLSAIGIVAQGFRILKAPKIAQNFVLLLEKLSYMHTFLKSATFFVRSSQSI